MIDKKKIKSSVSEKSTKKVEDNIVDAVFVIGTGSENENEELKYALRDLEKFCPFIRDVYISGECPDWVDTTVVKHLKWPDKFRHAKDANIIDKLRHACEQPGIAKNILFCSDDQFVTKPCKWEDFEARWLRRYDPNDDWYESRNRLWHTRLHKTLDRDRRRRKSLGLNQSDVFYYQPHIWMPIDRDKFIEYAKWCDYEHRDDTIIASGYFNFIDAGGKQNFDHIFITPGQKWPVKETHVAYSDTSYTDAMRYLRTEFPNQSKYEKAIEVEKIQEEKVQQKIEEPKVDPDTIKSFMENVLHNPVWQSMRQSILMAEDMRSKNFQGWDIVWKDIITRWKMTTEDGKLKLPVTKPPAGDVASIIEAFKKHSSPESTPVQKTEPIKPGARCPTCEERSRMAKAAADANLARARLQGSGACKECMIDHLSVAIAYLSSNAGRPTSFDTALARGEARVAAQHLLELNYNEEYKKCVSALDSFYSARSEFSAETLRSILKQAMLK